MGPKFKKKFKIVSDTRAAKDLDFSINYQIYGIKISLTFHGKNMKFCEIFIPKIYFHWKKYFSRYKPLKMAYVGIFAAEGPNIIKMWSHCIIWCIFQCRRSL